MSLGSNHPQGTVNVDTLWFSLVITGFKAFYVVHLGHFYNTLSHVNETVQYPILLINYASLELVVFLYTDIMV